MKLFSRSSVCTAGFVALALNFPEATNTLDAAIRQVAADPASVPSSYNSQRMGFSRTYPTNFSDWANAFLAGNGKMGIMVFGDPLNETVIFNDRGFNMAKTRDRSFAQVSAADLAAIKSDCAAGNFAAANKLAVSSAHYQGGGEGNRHPGFAMLISIPPGGAISDYARTCNFRTGEITVHWTDDRGRWERKAFVSRKDNVIVQYLTVPAGRTLSCSIQLAAGLNMRFPRDMTFTNESDTNYLNLRAKYPGNTGGAGYEGVTRVITAGGMESMDGDVLNISNATAVILLTRTAKYYSNCVSQWNQRGLQSGLAEVPADYAALLDGQIATHQAIYDRVKIDLGASAAERALPNEELLDRQRNSSTPIKALWERVFDAGRYYYLSSSSDVSPPDLLGMWTGDCNAGWGGFYHLDANLNLQISGGNIGDMPEAMEGYFKINESWRADLATNAKKLLGCRGIVACGNTPGMIPGAALTAGVSDFYPYQYATGEEPWLLYPFWEHYLITGDTNFLHNELYPLLKDLGHFYEDFLRLTDTNGHYIFAGSVSPENQPANLKVSLLNNSVFDISGAKFALSALIQTCNTLGLDQGAGQGVETWSNILDKLPPYLINPDGALQEWTWPGLKDNYVHRHMSQLLPVWPYGEITPERNAALFDAAAVVLARKDAYHETAGHGLLHGALIAARLGNARSVNKRLLQLTSEDYYYNSLASSHYNKHGTFCTDTCHAVPAIMMEMLVGSSPGILELLPAVPPALDHGAISGVKGRNRVTVQSLSWDTSNHAVDCVLKSDVDQEITLIERSGIDTISTSASVSSSPLGQIARFVQLVAGVSTHIVLGLGQLRQTTAAAILPASASLAWKRPTTVSSVADDDPGANAVDGDEDTRWSSAYADHQWIYVDLGNSRTINEVKLNWEQAAGKDYDIEVSDDADTWKTIKSITNNSETGWLDYPGLIAKGRYVRINGKTRTTQYGFSLWEFQVFGR
jgi:alpha-L-fucosidase 2